MSPNPWVDSGSQSTTYKRLVIYRQSPSLFQCPKGQIVSIQNLFPPHETRLQKSGKLEVPYFITVFE